MWEGYLMVMKTTGSTEQRDQGGEGGLHGPHSGGPGAGSTMAKGNSASLAPHEPGNEAGTGSQGAPPATHSITGTPNPQTTGIGEGTILVGGRGQGYVK